jgi:protein-S-isoprenylcysteine O-methyltransferase Ste14
MIVVSAMILLKGLAAAVLFFELPVPIFWLVLHLPIGFWRKHVRAAYPSAVLVAWGVVGFALIMFHDSLFSREAPPVWAIILGLALIACDGWMFHLAHRDMGTSRIVGRVELSGGGEMASAGIYARIRHPRYAGMMAAVAGACLLAGTLTLWVVAAVWWLVAMLSIAMEERELRARFGSAYVEYSRRVPRILPLRFWPRSG